jgi:excisionase family DNA binding protein
MSEFPQDSSPTPIDPPILVDAEEVARLLSLKVRTIGELRRNRDFPYVETGKYIRYRIDDVKKWVDQQANKKRRHG